MKYLYWIIATIVVATGLFIAMSVKFEVPTTNRIPFAQFESVQDLSKALIQNFQIELQKHDLIFLGVTPRQVEDIELWQSFLDQLKGTPLEYSVVVVERKLPYIENFKDVVSLDVTTERERLIDGIIGARKQNFRMAVILPYHYSSQMVSGNPVNVIMANDENQILSLTALKFPLTRQQEASFEPACLLEERQDPTGTGQLGCTVIRFSQKTYQEKVLDNHFSSFVEQISPTDFLVLLNRNSGSR